MGRRQTARLTVAYSSVEGALERMTARDRGTLVQGRLGAGLPGHPAAGGVLRLQARHRRVTESVITELVREKSNVEISMVHMPGMNTTQFGWVRTTLSKFPQPVAPIYQPDACAEMVASVVDHHKRRVWVGESTVGTIIGNRVASAVLDLYLGLTWFSGQQTGTSASEMAGDTFTPPSAGTTARTAPSTTAPGGPPRRCGRRSTATPSPASRPAPAR